MAGFFLRGALLEYGTDVLGPLPNIVVFQFNPEEISRTLNISNNDAADTQSDKRQRELSQTGSPPVETFDITAHFSAADELGAGGAAAAVPRVFGVGPVLAALEKMVYPSEGLVGGVVGAAVDAVANTLSIGAGASVPRPREQLPRILFYWGPSRLLPVQVRSMSITEQKFDPLLNPVQAQVVIGLSVAQIGDGKYDSLGFGALQYTQTVKEAQVLLNLEKVGEFAVDVIPF